MSKERPIRPRIKTKRPNEGYHKPAQHRADTQRDAAAASSAAPLTITSDVLEKLAGAVVIDIDYPDDGSDYIVLRLENVDSGERFHLYADAPSIYGSK